jgi:hypothetical protein
MRPELRAVVEDAYEVFGAYRVRHSLSVCIGLSLQFLHELRA